MPRPPRDPSNRRGFTLLEMVIVAAVLAALAAVVGPAVRRTLAKGELTDAGKQVRSALVKARLRAIESGLPWQFRFQPGTGCFAATRADDSPPGADRLEGRPARKPLESPIEGKLPGRVVFEPPSRETPESEREPRRQTVPGGPWSAPLVFQPNGRAPDARFRLRGAEGRGLEVVFRGLTGTAAIGSSRHAEEVP